MRLVPALFLALLAGCNGGDAKEEPFALERVKVERIEAATSKELADAIFEQVGGSQAFPSSNSPGTREEVRAQWSRLVASAVYRDQAPLDDIAYDYRGPLITTSEGVAFGGGGGEGLPVSVYETASEDAFRRIVEENVEALGLELVSLEFIEPEGITVPLVVVRAPANFLERSGGEHLGYSIFNGAADDSLSLGWYADVVDENGVWVQSQGLVPTAGTGDWARAERWSGHDDCNDLPVCTVHG